MGEVTSRPRPGKCVCATLPRMKYSTTYIQRSLSDAVARRSARGAGSSKRSSASKVQAAITWRMPVRSDYFGKCCLRPGRLVKSTPAATIRQPLDELKGDCMVSAAEPPAVVKGRHDPVHAAAGGVGQILCQWASSRCDG